jgi:iron complex transport system substrate-binding protein
MRTFHARPHRAGIAIAIIILICSTATAEGPRYAKAFTLEKIGGYMAARVVSPWRGASTGFTYIFYERGKPKPALRETGAVFVETPIRRAVTFSTTYVAALEALGVLDSLVGVDSAAYVYSAAARARIQSGAAVEVTKNWSPNLELLVRLAPEAVFTYGMGNEWDSHPMLAEAGLPVVICAEWMEDSPLGRAEWIKFFALFYGKAAQAEAAFSKIEKAYLDATAAAAGRKGGAPKVLANAPFQGQWTVPGGRSYMAALIADAGGDYLWKDDPQAGGLTLSVEAVYSRALDADVWINPGTASALAELAAWDPRFKDIPAAARGAVFNSSKKSLPSGANDYFESAALRPDLVLKDLAAIFRLAAPDGGTAQEPTSLEYFIKLK